MITKRSRFFAGLAVLSGLTLVMLSLTSPAIVTAQSSVPSVPPIPDPAAVSLDSPTTAFLALDFVTTICSANRAVSCPGTLPAVTAGMAAAHAANVPVIYSSFAGATIVPDVQPGPSDTVVISTGADKFFNTNLDEILKQHGVTTLVLTGTFSNGAVLYTAFEASARGYTVVVAADGLSAPTDFATYATEWQLLNGPGTANTQNTPLAAKAVTLSRLDLITYI